VLVQDFSNPVEPGGDGNPSMLIFTNNVFTGGYLQLFVGGYASNYIPVNINYNTFNSNPNGWCFAGRMLTGSIDNNIMTRSNYNSTMGLWQSNPGLTNNNITNQNGSTMYLSAAYPVTAPTINNENYLVWYGGYNRFNATNGDNISLSVSKPILDNGLNCFTISSSSSYYHLYGNIPTAETIYPASNNGWQGNGNAPKKYLYNINSVSVSVSYLPTISCGYQIPFNSFIVNELGDGYYDTVWVSDNNLGIQAPEDEVLYSQAEESRGSSEYFDAITDLKNLIDNYDSSNYLCTSLYDLFTCYEGLDTSDQSHRDIIFGDLKFYLSNKIVQYEDKAEFVSIAYNLILMCEAKIENYNEAMTGYEFISLYHPDPEQRILASMDYGYIQELLNGMGGGESSHERSRMTKKSTKAGHERSRMMLKLMDKKPYTRIVKDMFIKGSKELEKKLNDDVSKTDKRTIQKKELIERAKENISVSRGLSREQREQRRMGDIKLLIKDESQDINKVNNIPSNYSLHQNYPNPFNPVTTIKYELPKDEFISFKIYDILGREVYSINEFKKAGVYVIKFDGSNYSSGIYFYRLESGSFVETKKMVLVK
jgi:tetratricopeptide (TPR) repeat protein